MVSGGVKVASIRADGLPGTWTGVEDDTLRLSLANHKIFVLIHMLLWPQVLWVLVGERPHANLLSVHLRGALGIRLHVQIVCDGSLSGGGTDGPRGGLVVAEVMIEFGVRLEHRLWPLVLLSDLVVVLCPFHWLVLRGVLIVERGFMLDVTGLEIRIGLDLPATPLWRLGEVVRIICFDSELALNTVGKPLVWSWALVKMKLPLINHQLLVVLDWPLQLLF